MVDRAESMLRFQLTLCLCCLPLGAVANDPSATVFELADGLVLERIADESLIRWPVVADWDSQGNLLVVESGGVAWPIQQHNEQRLHKVVRLHDDDQDGIFDRRVVVAEDLPFAEGVLAVDSRLLVAAPPNIWELVDGDGDGICEQRRVWFDGPTITNCANDLHGPYLGRDSWIYWCKGAFAEQTHELTDGSILRDRAAHIFRRRLEGGAIESLIAGGMDNPVELAITPEGEKFFTSTFLQHPGDGKRDGIGHAVYGSVFGKDHDVIDDLIRTGPLMPIMTHLGPAAPSGLAVLENPSQLLGSQHAASRILVSAQFNLHKVTAHILKNPQDKADFQTEDMDLLSTDQVDFHPTDILEDADGSLLVIDTGGWYDLCCPTSRVDQKVAAGGIFRLRAATASRPSGESNRSGDVNTQEIEELLASLSDSRAWLSRASYFAVKRLGEKALPALQRAIENRQAPLKQRLDCLWCLSWMGNQSALDLANQTLAQAASELSSTPASNAGKEQARTSASATASLAMAACHIVGLHRYQPAQKSLEKLLACQQAVLRRAAVEALGRIGKSESIAPLMHCLAQAEGSRALQHSCIYALVEIGDSDAVAAYLSADSYIQRSAALTVLDQLKDSRWLTSQTVLDAAFTKDAALIDTAVNILQHHPEWAEAAADRLHGNWQNAQATDGDVRLDIIGAFRGELPMQHRVAEWMQAAPEGPSSSLTSALRLWSKRDLPAAFVGPLANWLHTAPEETLVLIDSMRLDTASAQPLIQQIIEKIASSADLKEKIRLAQVLPDGQVVNDAELLDALMDQGDYATLARFKLSARQARRLASMIDTADATELPDLLKAISKAGEDELDKAVVTRLYALPVARTLNEGALQSLYRNRGAELQKLAKETDAVLQLAPKNVQAAVQQVLESLPQGDAVRGLQVFRSRLANCSACHQMGYLGGKTGPELTRIGNTRTREALLEAILYPSIRIEQSFRPVKILTTDGQIMNGLVLTKTADKLELQTAADKTESIDLSDIESQQPSETSIMPAGMLDILSPQQLADLLALLESAK
ncbi:MAG: c-type cytochrome [bacterium]|nr:c-type cytochrome [bacterium]